MATLYGSAYSYCYIVLTYHKYECNCTETPLLCGDPVSPLSPHCPRTPFLHREALRTLDPGRHQTVVTTVSGLLTTETEFPVKLKMTWHLGGALAPGPGQRKTLWTTPSGRAPHGLPSGPDAKVIHPGPSQSGEPTTPTPSAPQVSDCSPRQPTPGSCWGARSSRAGAHL